MSFYNELIDELSPLYELPHVIGGHTVAHVRGVERLGENIFPRMPEVDPFEYRVAAWLHNIDRCVALKTAVAKSGGLPEYLRLVLSESPFEEGAQARIVDAVLQHGKKDDDLVKDSPLLTAIRIADKLDRFTPLNLLAGPAHRSNLPHYDEKQPFGYQTSADCHLKFFLWNVEWYRMLPYDWARDLVVGNYFRQFLRFLREFGRDIAERHSIPNGIEDDLRTALGSHYDQWR